MQTMKPGSPLSSSLAWLACGALGLALAASCEDYVPPPKPTIAGLSSGVLSDPRAPLVVDFGTSIDPDTLSVRVALLETDVEGNLYDEDSDPATELHVLLRHDASEGDLGAAVEVDAGRGRLVLTPQSALPVGPKLVLLVEGGLASKSGSVSRHRVRVPFSYVVSCSASTAPSSFPTGTYFVLLEVEKPVGSQIQLLAYIDVDPTTGALSAQFTNADRSPAQQCPTACASTEVCRLLPSPECVAPSTRAGTVDEWPDFVPNPTPPTGYSFPVQGCTTSDGAAHGVLTAPATMVVEQPAVTVGGLVLTSSFVAGEDGVVRATGSLTADVVRLGEGALGAGQGTMTAVKIPDDRAPAGIPRPPARDGGAPTHAPDGGE
jgi:hypothetical protein